MCTHTQPSSLGTFLLTPIYTIIMHTCPALPWYIYSSTQLLSIQINTP